MKILFKIALILCGSLALAQVTGPGASQVPVAASPSGGLVSWLQLNGTMIFGVLFGISEALAVIPAVKANSVFQLIYNALEAVYNSMNPPTQSK